MMDVVGSYRISYPMAMDIIDGMIADEILGKYENVTTVIKRENTDDGSVNYFGRDRVRLPGEMYVTIGVKSLTENQNSYGFVRDVDLVRMVKTIGHETRHIRQMREIYQNPELSGYYLDMARAQMIYQVFGSYFVNTYAYAPCEIDADLYGFRHAAEYLDANLVKSDGTPLIDTKACLMQVVEEQPSWRGEKSCPDFESMLAAVEKRKYEYKVRDHIGDFYPMPGDNDLKIAAYKHWMPVLKRCSDIGVAQDEILFSAAMDVNPTFVGLTAGLVPEAKRVRKLYPAKCGIVEKIARAVNSDYPVADVCDGRGRDVSDLPDIAFEPGEDEPGFDTEF